MCNGFSSLFPPFSFPFAFFPSDMANIKKLFMGSGWREKKTFFSRAAATAKTEKRKKRRGKEKLKKLYRAFFGRRRSGCQRGSEIFGDLEGGCLRSFGNWMEEEKRKRKAVIPRKKREEKREGKVKVFEMYPWAFGVGVKIPIPLQSLSIFLFPMCFCAKRTYRLRPSECNLSLSSSSLSPEAMCTEHTLSPPPFQLLPSSSSSALISDQTKEFIPSPRPLSLIHRV